MAIKFKDISARVESTWTASVAGLNRDLQIIRTNFKQIDQGSFETIIVNDVISVGSAEISASGGFTLPSAGLEADPFVIKVSDDPALYIYSNTAGTASIDVSASHTVLDEDDMISDSAVNLATQQSTRAYIDNRFTSASFASTASMSAYLTKDGTVDLTDNWTISTANITLTTGILTANQVEGDYLNNQIRSNFHGNVYFEATSAIAICGTCVVDNEKQLGFGTPTGCAYIQHLELSGVTRFVNTQNHDGQDLKLCYSIGVTIFDALIVRAGSAASSAGLVVITKGLQTTAGISAGSMTATNATIGSNYFTAGIVTTATIAAGYITAASAVIAGARFFASGSVGIGLPAPGKKFDVLTEIRVQNPSYPKYFLKSTNSGDNVKNWQIYINPPGTLHFGALNDAEDAELNTVRFQRNGDVWIYGDCSAQSFTDRP